MDHSLVSEIATCIIAAWGLAVLAQLWRQPLILAYLPEPRSVQKAISYQWAQQGSARETRRA